MTFVYEPHSEDVWSAILRSFFEADHGYVKVALDRLQELSETFPNNYEIINAQATIRSKNLGQGTIAYDLFEKVVNLVEDEYFRPYFFETADMFLWCHEGASISKELAAYDLRLTALFSLIDLAPNEEKFHFWAQIALSETTPKLKKYQEKNFDGEAQKLMRMIMQLESGTPYSRMLFNESQHPAKTRLKGIQAAQIQAALQTSIKPQYETSLRYKRAILLRSLDLKAQEHRAICGVGFPAEERLELKEAINEINRCLVLEKNNVVFQSHKAELEEALTQVNKPLYNLRKLIKKNKATNPSFKAFSEANLTPGSKEETELILSSPALSVLLRKIRSGAISNAEEEKYFVELKGFIIQIAIQKLQNSEAPANQIDPMQFVQVVAELLSRFTSDSLFSEMAEFFLNKKEWVEPILNAAKYLALNAKGLLQHDATRFLCLMPFWADEKDRVKDYYQKNILVGACLNAQELSCLKDTLEKEMAQLNPLFLEIIKYDKLSFEKP